MGPTQTNLVGRSGTFRSAGRRNFFYGISFKFSMTTNRVPVRILHPHLSSPPVAHPHCYGTTILFVYSKRNLPHPNTPFTHFIPHPEQHKATKHPLIFNHPSINGGVPSSDTPSQKNKLEDPFEQSHSIHFYNLHH